ncbi:apical endosomal glycoprotein [Pelodytes ibericus]
MHRLYILLLLLALYGSVPPAAPAGCQSPATTLCNFICDCWDCSDEAHCGYNKCSEDLGASFGCDFEHDDCGWTDISPTSHRWARERLSSPMWGTRPHADHTLRNRWGWFLGTGGHRGKSAATASVRSPVLRDSAATCEINIHYHMWSADGPGNGSLSVQLTANSQSYSVWESSGKSSLSWRQAVIYTGRIQGEYQLTLSSSWDPSITGMVAIDDLAFRHCALPAVQPGCSSGQFKCARGSCVEERAVCDGSDDCGDNSDELECGQFNFCNFENATSGWKEQNWPRVNGYSSRPGRDHSFNSRSGYFLGAEKGTAMLTGSITQKGPDACSLVLYYLMDGSSNSRLLINYKSLTIPETKVLERTGARGNVWLREKAIFPNITETFQILITGTIGEGTDPIIALDDLILSPDCVLEENYVASPPMSSHSSFPVRANGNCIPVPDKVDLQSSDWIDVSVGMQQWRNDLNIHPERAISYVSGHLQVSGTEGNLLTSAEIHSPSFCATGPSCSLNMTYYFNSGPQGSFSVRVLDPEFGSHTNVWHSQELSPSSRSVLIPLGERLQPFQLVLSAFVDPLPTGEWYAAVNDIQFLQCKTEDPPAISVPVTCNFETGPCGWYQDQSEELDWEMGTLSDHSTGSGSFMYVEGRSRTDRGLKARLKSYPQSSDQDTQCLSLYYRIWGPDAGTLSLYVKYDGEEEKLLWTATGSQGNSWHHESLTLTNTKRKYQVFLDAVRDGSVGQISVDDITLRGGSCAVPTRCSFEAGSCDFTTEGAYQWKRQQGAHATPHMGPYFDHTQQTLTGHYMLVDTSKAALPNKKSATLRSGWHEAQLDPGCLSFWYQTGGSNAGNLNVHLVEKAGKRQVSKLLLSVSGTLSDGWHLTSVALQSQWEWMVQFEAVGAGGVQCFISVDDLHISHHPCHEQATCDFESGPCSWTNVRIPLMDTYDWDWSSGTGLTEKITAPGTDHSLATPEGHYAFVDTGALDAEGSSAWLISEHLPPTKGSCFTFWYRVDSSHSNHLGELILYSTSHHGLQPLWFLRGYRSNGWQQEQLQINSTVEFQLTFEASKGPRPQASTISLDDLMYTMDLPCNVEKVERGKITTGTVLLILLGVLLILLCMAAAYILYRRRKTNQQSRAQESNHDDGMEGFDNVVFGEPADAASTSSDRFVINEITIVLDKRMCMLRPCHLITVCPLANCVQGKSNTAEYIGTAVQPCLSHLTAANYSPDTEASSNTYI